MYPRDDLTNRVVGCEMIIRSEGGARPALLGPCALGYPADDSDGSRRSSHGWSAVSQMAAFTKASESASESGPLVSGGTVGQRFHKLRQMAPDPHHYFTTRYAAPSLPAQV